MHGRTGIFVEELLRFQNNVVLFWCLWTSPVPQNLAEICRNMGICCGFRAAAREKYPEFVLLNGNGLVDVDIEENVWRSV